MACFSPPTAGAQRAAVRRCAAAAAADAGGAGAPLVWRQIILLVVVVVVVVFGENYPRATASAAPDRRRRVLVISGIASIIVAVAHNGTRRPALARGPHPAIRIVAVLRLALVFFLVRQGLGQEPAARWSLAALPPSASGPCIDPQPSR
jgi:hypothetical protein